MSDLWVDRYRPKSVKDYVFRDERLQQQVSGWIKDGIIPNLIISGDPGCGKSVLSQLIRIELGIQSGDFSEINCAEQTSIEVIRNKVMGFASTTSWGKFKIQLMEEYSEISVQAQHSLKRIIEDSSDNCRFIFTTNHIHKIIPAIISRCQVIQIDSLDEDQFRLKLAEILSDNNIIFDIEVLDNYMKATYPDMRKAINSIQQNSLNGVLQPPNADSGKKESWLVAAIDLFKKNKITEARTLLCDNAGPNDWEELFRLLYRNLIWFADTEDQMDAAIILIKDGLVAHSQVAYPDINFAATLCQLKSLRE